MTVRINKQKINLREKLTEFEDKVNFDEVVRGLGEYTGNVGIGVEDPGHLLHIKSIGVGDFAIEGTQPRIWFKEADQTDLDILMRNHAGQFRIDVTKDNGNLVSTPFLINNTNGNVGIGTTNPDRPLVIGAGTYSAPLRLIARSTDENCAIQIRNSTNTATLTQLGGNLNSYFMGGNVSIGTSDTSGQLYVKSPVSSQTCRMYRSTNISTARVFDILSNFGGTNTVQFLVNANGTTQNTSGTISQISSDERLKENISDANPKLQDLLKLKVKNFNFSDDENKTKYIGFVAQEMEEVFPSLVMTKDTREYDEDGNLLSGLEDSKSTKVSMDFAILTKAIQEQQSIIEDLKSRIETLESK